MVWVASGIQTARIRHGDKGSLCRRMSNALTDESETLLSLFLSVFSCSSLLSFLSIYSPPRSAFPFSYLYLSEAVAPSFLSLPSFSLQLLHSFCFLPSDVLSLSISAYLPISCLILLTSLSVSIHVCIYSIHLILSWHEPNYNITYSITSFTW